MKKVLLFAVMVGSCFGGLVEWQGVDWTTYPDVSATEDVSGGLTVVSTGGFWVRLDHGIPGTDYFGVSVDLDEGPQSALMVADYDGSTEAEIAINFPAGEIGYDNGTGTFTWDPIAALPGVGQHTVSFEKGIDGLVTINLNGSFLWKATTGYEIDTIQQTLVGAIPPDGTGYFGDYTIPEPATMALLALGGLLIRKRK